MLALILDRQVLFLNFDDEVLLKLPHFLHWVVMSGVQSHDATYDAPDRSHGSYRKVLFRIKGIFLVELLV